MDKKIMTIAQVAEYLQISEVTAYKLVQEERIPAFKIGTHWRVDLHDLYAYISNLAHGETL